jgi:hypothetical protein
MAWRRGSAQWEPVLLLCQVCSAPSVCSESAPGQQLLHGERCSMHWCVIAWPDICMRPLSLHLIVTAE